MQCEGENNLKEARGSRGGKRLVRYVREKEERGGGGRKMSETKREEIALKAVDLSELNHRRPAVHPDSASTLNITDA